MRGTGGREAPRFVVADRRTRQADAVDTICDDLAAEHADLDRLLADLPDDAWDRPTPSPGWSVRDQVSHLWFFDQRALLALEDPVAFAADAKELMRARDRRSMSPPVGRSAPRDLLDAWRADRAGAAGTRRAPPIRPTRVPWYGPAMAARSFITARLMETWAHGQDVVDTLGVDA